MKTKTKKQKWGRQAKFAISALAATVCAIFGAGLSKGDVNAVEQSWGPERPTYTWEKPADHVTFNSITNNPKVGDERNFVRIRKANTNDTLTDKVNLEVGQEYEVFIWFHNNASSTLNKKDKGSVGIAKNVRLRVEQPQKVNANTNAIIKGLISADDSDPGEVWDIAYAYSKESVLLDYVPNSATIHSSGNINGQILSSDALFGKTGSYLGYWNDLWGVLPGCNEYAGYVTYHFKVDQPGFSMNKTVSKELENDYKEKITVAPGDKLDFKIDYKNTGTMTQESIIAYDYMPNGLNYVKGTSFLKSSFGKGGAFVSDKLFDGGINLGDFKPGESTSLTYKVEVADDKTIFPCGDTVVYNNASIATAVGTIYDKTEVTVHRDCEDNPTTPNTPSETIQKCTIVKGTYYGSNGDEVDYDTYKSQCETPAELPKTGPTEIMLAVVIVGGIGIATAYYINSRKELKKLEK